ncbi:MAG: hypothetical protein ACRD2U_06940 [Terriglobales bacterium]
MPDSLYLSLWYQNSDADEMLPHALSVLRQFPSSAERPGIAYLAVHPVSWNEPTILERRFHPGVTPEEAVLIASDLLHEDYAYEFEAYWDLWLLSENGAQWIPKPSLVRFTVRGAEFDDRASEREGQIQMDFGVDSAFLQEEVELTAKAESSVRANVQKLVEFTNKAEKMSGASARLLWSESEENLAQKLIARLQRVQ